MTAFWLILWTYVGGLIPAWVIGFYIIGKGAALRLKKVVRTLTPGYQFMGAKETEGATWLQRSYDAWDFIGALAKGFIWPVWIPLEIGLRAGLKVGDSKRTLKETNEKLNAELDKIAAEAGLK